MTKINRGIDLRQVKKRKNIFEDLFLHNKPVNMITSLKLNDIQYATQVSKYVDCTYSHTVKVLDMFRQLGLVEFEKKGRIKMVRLTPEGEEVALHFEGIRKKFERLHSEIKLPAAKK